MRASTSRMTIGGVRITADGLARALLYALPFLVTLDQFFNGRSIQGPFIIAVAALGVYSLWRSRVLVGLDLRRESSRWRRARPEAYALFIALLAYLLVIALSYTVAYSTSPVLEEVRKWGEIMLTVGAGWGFIRSERHALWLAWSAIAAGVAEALIGCWQDIFSVGLPGVGGLRVIGTFGQPNPFAGFLNLSLPIAISLAVFGHDPRMRWAAGGASAISLFALYLSGSRGALIGLATAVVVIVTVGWRLERKAAIAVVIGVPLLAVAWVTHLIPARLENSLLAQFRINDVSLNAQLNHNNVSTIERLAHWVAGIRMFEAHPILGVGAGNYGVAYPYYKVHGWDAALGHAHNYYINAAAETGILGLLAFLAVVGAAIWVCWRATRVTGAQRGEPLTPGQANTRALAIGLAAAVIALCAHNLVDNMFVHAMQLQFALWLGVLLWMATPATPVSHARATNPRRRPVPPAGAD